MVNQELLQYVRQEFQAGVAKENIQATLIKAGWTESDVKDALLAVSPASATSPASPVTSPMVMHSAVAATPAITTKPMVTSPEMIKPAMPAEMAKPISVAQSPVQNPMTTSHASTMPVSFSGVSSPASRPISGMDPKPMDSVKSNFSASPSVSFPPSSAPGMINASKHDAMMDRIMPIADTMKGSAVASPAVTMSSGKKGGGAMFIVLGLLFGVALGFGAKWYLDIPLSDQLLALQSDGQNAGVQSATLSQKVTDLTSQISSLSAQNTDLTSQVAFFAVPALVGTSTLPVSVATSSIKGTIALSAGQYTLTTKGGIVITVKNSANAKVDVALKPLIGTVADLSGTHAVGSASFTVTTVNGTPIQ